MEGYLRGFSFLAVLRSASCSLISIFLTSLSLSFSLSLCTRSLFLPLSFSLAPSLSPSLHYKNCLPKLYFRHGAVSSAKTLNLLACAHSYRAQGKTVLLIKPALDTRFGADVIKSRAGLENIADVLVTPTTDLLQVTPPSGIHCVIVDESQFLSPRHIEQLRAITALWQVPVICYGLRTDFRTRLFPGSARLLELADTIEEIKTTCFFCNRKAVYNLKHVDGVACVEGPAVQLGAEETYFPACYQCYEGQLGKAGKEFPRAGSEELGQLGVKVGSKMEGSKMEGSKREDGGSSEATAAIEDGGGGPADVSFD